MTTTQRVLVGNIIVLISYLVIIQLFVMIASDYSDASMIYNMLAILAHIGICMFATVVCYMMKKNEAAKGYLLSVPVILLIGFPACFGGLYIPRV